MAAGDINYDTDPARRAGNVNVLHGTIEVDDTYRAYALGGTGITLITCSLQDEDGVGSAECDLNVNASGTSVNGSIAVAGNHVSVNTYRFRAEFV